MKTIFAAFFLSFSLAAIGADLSCSQMGSAATDLAYKNVEFREYVCAEDERCPLNEFSERINVARVNLDMSLSRRTHCGFFVTPTQKYRQYPTLVVVWLDGSLREVLSDYENGLSVASSGIHGMRDLVSQAHPSPDMLVKRFYCWNGGDYRPARMQCFKVKALNNGRSTSLVPQVCQ